MLSAPHGHGSGNGFGFINEKGNAEGLSDSDMPEQLQPLPLSPFDFSSSPRESAVRRGLQVFATALFGVLYQSHSLT